MIKLDLYKILDEDRTSESHPPENYYVSQERGCVHIVVMSHGIPESVFLTYNKALANYKQPSPRNPDNPPKSFPLGGFGDEFGGVVFELLIPHYNGLGLYVCVSDTDSYWAALYGCNDPDIDWENGIKDI